MFDAITKFFLQNINTTVNPNFYIKNVMHQNNWQPVYLTIHIRATRLTLCMFCPVRY
jgi:hypothetical protein